MMHFNNTVLHCYCNVVLLWYWYSCNFVVLLPSMVNVLWVWCTCLRLSGRAQNKWHNYSDMGAWLYSLARICQLGFINSWKRAPWNNSVIYYSSFQFSRFKEVGENKWKFNDHFDILHILNKNILNHKCPEWNGHDDLLTTRLIICISQFLYLCTRKTSDDGQVV